MKRLSLLLLMSLATMASMIAQTILIDFESPETSSDFQYFGSVTQEGLLTTIDANPNVSGINTSENVGTYVKGPDAQGWAGAFSLNENLSIDLSEGGEICVQIHVDHPGNLALKLEQSQSEGPDWIFIVENDVVDEWTEVCFNTSLPSIEAPFQGADGDSFGRLVLFFDFNIGGNGEFITSYFDNITIQEGSANQTAVLDLSLDLSDFADPFDQVFVMGTFNDWNESNELFNNGIGIYETSIELPIGLHEYLFWIKGPDLIESFNGTEQSGCILASPDGEFVNRQVLLTEDTTMPLVCWNSCYQCGEGVEVTINLGFPDGTDPDPNGDIYLAGGEEFGVPGGSFKMTDEDGDGIYSISFTRLPGFEGYYSFANGNCPDWSCKEDLEGQDCARVENFNDRYMDAISGPTIIDACYGLCGSIAQCGGIPTDIAELENKSTITLLGQSSDWLTVEVEGLAIGSPIVMSSIVGQRIGETVTDATQVKLPIHQLASGLYIITVGTGAQSASVKFYKH